jgi:hypothetical protein
MSNIVVKSLNSGARKVLLLSHGGYTPKRGFIRRGSGIVVVPMGLTLFFNSELDSPSIGTKAIHLLQGFPLTPVDTKLEGSLINNYSLEYNALFERCLPTAGYDLMTISPRGKTHMKDVFNYIRSSQKGYELVHVFACRINKLTYNF